MKSIITSLLDTDFYKLTMAQAVFHQYYDAQVEYQFINRTSVKFPDNFDKFLDKQISFIRQIQLSKEESNYLQSSCHEYLKEDFIEWLAEYSFDPSELSIHQKNGVLSLKIHGSWLRTIFWETPLLAIITELYYQTQHIQPSVDWETDIKKKAQKLEQNDIYYVDFGTRRRYSKQIHEAIIPLLKQYSPTSFVGTSNVSFAMKYDLKPIGTFAHEWVMAHMSNKKALRTWLKEYQGNLSIALTDTLTTRDFLKVFNKTLASEYRGVRHDSGDPVKFIDTIVNHYQALGIDPKEKTIIFSNNLNVNSVVEIAHYAKGKIKAVFGIGGALTNDFGVPRFDIVIKMTKMNGKKVYKLSDDPYKSTKTL